MTDYLENQINLLADKEQRLLFQSFVTSQAYQPLTENLVGAVIKELGGVSEFLDHYFDIAKTVEHLGGLEGIIDKDDNSFFSSPKIEQFYLQHSDDIAMLLNFGYGHNHTALTMIMRRFRQMAVDLNIDDINKAMSDVSSKNRKTVINAIVCHIVEELSFSYANHVYYERFTGGIAKLMG